jgi:hypothetical protein
VICEKPEESKDENEKVLNFKKRAKKSKKEK